MCNYQGYEFGAGSYPDSYCLDGFLHDADSDYLNDEAIPCPMCDREAAIAYWTERNAMFWDDGEDMDDEAAHNLRASTAAISLVDDIRFNRGVRPPLPVVLTESPPCAHFARARPREQANG